MITPSTNHDSPTTGYDASSGMTVDPTVTGSISNNPNCSPAADANPAPLPTELKAPSVRSCNPRW